MMLRLSQHVDMMASKSGFLKHFEYCIINLIILFIISSVPLLREVPEETLAKIADVLEEVIYSCNSIFVAK